MSQKEDHKVTLTMVVNGKPYSLPFALGQKLHAIVAETLDKTGNMGQPSENWDLRDSAGNLLDLNQHLQNFRFPENTELFLNPRAGAGG